MAKKKSESPFSRANRLIPADEPSHEDQTKSVIAGRTITSQYERVHRPHRSRKAHPVAGETGSRKPSAGRERIPLRRLDDLAFQLDLSPP